MSNRPFRIAIRTGGETVNAYLAKTSTMDGAIQVASISRSIVAHKDVEAAWLELMRVVAAAIIQTVSPGAEVERIEFERAPEHERAGRA